RILSPLRLPFRHRPKSNIVNIDQALILPANKLVNKGQTKRGYCTYHQNIFQLLSKDNLHIT
ncbi:MAG: hypothetical protein KC421_18620, partial [Anaerolineales bacterium]|nr:hypothetical protein [Anaerolineales bacterium]